MHPALKFSDRITCLPVVYGSGDFAIQVREAMLAEKFDCLAVPLPPSFQTQVEQGVQQLPTISIVVQPETAPEIQSWNPDENEVSAHRNIASYVPIDPCQPVVQAIRVAMQERIPRHFVDLEVEEFEVSTGLLPDPYAVKRVTPEQFAAAVMPTLARPTEQQRVDRIHWMARELRRLEQQHKSILFVCSVLDWVWIREAWQRNETNDLEPASVYETEHFGVDPAR